MGLGRPSVLTVAVMSVMMLLPVVAGLAAGIPTAGRQLNIPSGGVDLHSVVPQLFQPTDENGSENGTNHPPVILNLWPLNNTDVDYNHRIYFWACATDPDGDPLSFYWRLSDGTLLKVETGKNSSTFSKILPGGKQYIVVLEVQDGKNGFTNEYMYIKVKPKPDSPDGPWPCGPLFLLPAAILPLIVRWKSHGPK